LPPVRIDPDAMGQALCNLLDNAVKYSGEGREIVVSLGARNGSVVLAVRDHGIGIAAEEQEKIFERFHRVGTGLVHDVKGSGLGLSIVSHIVKAHGGSIHVESERGRGSTFSIHLPLQPETGGATGWEDLRERGAEG
jgi:signal transduction histidine kinase